MVHDRRKKKKGKKRRKELIVFSSSGEEESSLEEFLHHQPHGTEELFLRPRTTDYRYGSPCVSCRPFFPWPKREFKTIAGKGTARRRQEQFTLKKNIRGKRNKEKPTAEKTTWCCGAGGRG
jgi:hypothetical protein